MSPTDYLRYKFDHPVRHGTAFNAAIRTSRKKEGGGGEKSIFLIALDSAGIFHTSHTPLDFSSFLSPSLSLSLPFRDNRFYNRRHANPDDHDRPCRDATTYQQR